VEGAIAAVQPHARALVNLRVPPGTDPVEAQDLLVAHIERRRPWGARVTIEKETVGHPFRSTDEETTDPAHELLGRCLAEAYGVADPAAAIHSPDESVDRREIERIALAEAAFLERLR